jgi:hypothetical protein
MRHYAAVQPARVRKCEFGETEVIIMHGVRRGR